ncbi:MAG: glycosyltransferase family 4 protein [Oscillospiraceae bacterium]
MTLCFFSAQYLPTVGGVERYTYNLAKCAIVRGHKAIVMTSAFEGLPQHETDADGIEIFRLPVIPLMGGRFPILKPCSEFGLLEKKLWSRKIDLVIANNLFYVSSIYAVGQAKKRGIPTILINHGTRYLMTGNKVLVLMGRVYEWLTAKLIKRSCTHFFAVSGEGVRWLKNTFDITADGVIYNAVSPSEIAELAKTGEKDWRVKLGLKPSAKIIGFSGRIIPEKGADRLCAAMKSIRESVPDAVVVLAGGGNLFERLKEERYDGVYLLGQQSYENSLSLIEQSNVFCLPTRSEGFASTVLEAAALKTPIITTSTGGSTELLQDESFGVLIPDMSEIEITRACVFALENEKWRRNAADKTYRKLCAQFTWEKSADALLNIANSIG